MKTLLLTLILAISAFSADCGRLYNKMLKTLPAKQVTTICRVTGINEDREDIMGFFFYFDVGGQEYPAVFIYGTDYDPMLYSDNDWMRKHATCITTNGYRAIKTTMSAEQILDKLFSFKTCDDGFKTEQSYDKLYM